MKRKNRKKMMKMMNKKKNPNKVHQTYYLHQNSTQMIGKESFWLQRIGKKNSNGSGKTLMIKDGLVGRQ